MQFEARNIGAIISEWSQIDPHCISVELQGKRHSRADIVGAAQLLATFFKDAGVKQGDAVAILAGEPLRGIEAMIALWSLEAVVLFLDPRQPVNEISRASDLANISSVFTDVPRFARKSNGTLLPKREKSVQMRNALTFPPESHNSEALILSSSGTTDIPRFRRITHKDFVENTQIAARLIQNPVPLPSVLVGSLAFGAILGNWIRVLIHGGFILSLPLFFRTNDLHSALSRTEIQAVGLPPVLIRELLVFHGKTDALVRGPHYPHIQRLVSTGGPIAPQDLIKAYEVLTPGMKNLYSMTGVGAVSVLSGDDIHSKSNSVGKPLPEVSVRIEDADGNLLPVGQTGRIVAKPEWKVDGTFVASGDLGWIDEEGFLYVSGRRSQIATRNSVNVNLQDLEHDVKQAPSVRDCIAFSVKSDSMPDDTVFLSVETLATVEVIQNQLRDAVATYRRPDKIMVAPRLPRNASNKIALRVLQDAAKQKVNDFVDF